MGEEGKGTVDMFLTRGLEKILRHAPRQKHPKLREECEIALGLVQKLHKQRKASKAPLSQTELITLANVSVSALRLGCQSSVPDIMCASLDSLQKLMAYGFIRGELPDMSGEKRGKKLIETVVETVSSCFDFPDDAVQLQIIKALLTSVTTPSCGVHSETLMIAVRTCYNIYLMSRNPVNQTTSKATLTQILNIIFARMETVCTGELKVNMEDESEEESEEGKQAAALAKSVVDSVFQSLGLFKTKEEKEEEEETKSEDKEGENKEEKDENKEAAEKKKPKEPKVPGDEDGEEENGEDELSSLAMSPPLSPISSPVSSPISSPLSSPRSGSRSLSPLKLNQKKIPEISPELTVTPMPDLLQNDDSDVIFHDCFLIFRALCKLSTKEASDKRRSFFNADQMARPNPIQAPDSLDMRSKILALQLLLDILESAGPVMRNHEKFIHGAIKKYLCVGVLSINGVSSVPHVFRLSLAIFTALLALFKNHLKHEIGVFFEKIFLRILESENSTTPQKWMVLESLLLVCKNPQTLVDIFLNYDCDRTNPRDVFERMVNVLSGIAKCLVTIMRSLVDWSKELYENEEEFWENSNHEESESSNRPPSMSLDLKHYQKESGDLARFERQMMYNQQVKKGKQRFNMKPKDGIKYLIGIGHFQDTPKDIANFLYTADGLDKGQIGEYLGGHTELHRHVRNEYVDNNFRFAGLEFDVAVRRFLTTFLLPKEAHPIDRIMEKFAERYFNDNPDSIFGNADAAYIFAYATIMLATDLHNKSIVKKITIEQWAKNLKGLNDDGDFPFEYLQKIYDRIGAAPLKLGLDISGPSSRPQSEMLTPKQRQSLFHQETTFIVKKSRESLREHLRRKNTFFKSTNIRHVRPMFSVSWCPMLAAFSYMLESTDDEKAVALCLEGFKWAIRVSSIFYMETEQKAFAKSLANFTLLDSHVKETKQKNIDAIKALLSLAHTDGNYLQDSWMQVLLCVSNLERLFLVGTGIPQPLAHVAPPKKVATKRTVSEEERHEAERLSGKGEGGNKNYEEQNAQMIVSKIDPLSIEKIFSHTAQLNGNAIVDFVKCLCKVSYENEIQGSSPRTYSLQKLVEVAYENMSRIRLVWTRIWTHIGDHFTRVGCSSNRKLAMYAVDSLRQLAMKFLEKDELSNYNFQKSFLKPFGHILEIHKSVQIRELVVHCLSQMIRSRASNIQSGWKSILYAFSIAGRDESPTIGSLAFETVEMVVTKWFNLVGEMFFIDVVHCLSAHARGSPVKEISIKAIKLVLVCADHLGKGDVVRCGSGGVTGSGATNQSSSSSSSSSSSPSQGVENGVVGSPRGVTTSLPSNISLTSSYPPPTSTTSPSSSSSSSPSSSLGNGGDDVLFATQNETHIKLWFAIFIGLSQSISHPLLTIRNAAAKQLFVILKNYGNLYTDAMWDMIFRGVIRPIFDSICHFTDQSKLSEEDNQWVSTTCQFVLASTVNLFGTYFQKMSPLLGDYLNLLIACVVHDNEDLASIGVNCLFSLVIENKAKWSQSMWDQVVTALGYILIETASEDALLLSKDQQLTVRSKDIDTKGILEPRPPLTPPTPTRKTGKRHRSLSSDVFCSNAPLKLEVDSIHLTRSIELGGKTIYSFQSIKRKRLSSNESLKNSMALIQGRTRVQLGIIKSIAELVETTYSSLSPQQMVRILDSLEQMILIVHNLNFDSSLWKDLGSFSGVWRGLIQEEMEGMTILCNLMFRMYGESSDSPNSNYPKLVEKRLFEVCMREMSEFVDNFPLEEDKEIEFDQAHRAECQLSKTKTTILILSSLFSLRDPQFTTHMRILYPFFCDLLMTNSPEIRAEVRKLFLRIGSHVDFNTSL